MMKILNLVQGSPEWIEHRRTHFNASDAPAMMGVSKYQTRSDLLKAKATGADRDIDANTQALFDRGHAAEAAARPIAERIIGDELFPVVTGTEIDGLRLSASLDGMTMAGDTLFEHKLYSQSLAERVRTGTLEPHYTVQMDQQMLVTGADKVLFMCSDGTEENCAWMWYYRNPEAEAAIVAGWSQFLADLANYQHIEDAPKPEGKAPETLPALRIELTGMVTASNLTEFRRTALAVIDGVNTDLQTDADFADAEKAVKWAKDVENRLDAAKQHALSQTASIDELFRTLDEIKDYARAKRLDLEKLVKTRKESIRVEILNSAKQALAAHIAKLEQRIQPLHLPAYQADFAGAMKNKRTVASLRDAVGTLLAQAKIDTSAMADEMEVNLKALDSLAGEYRHLFADLQQLATKPADDFAAAVKLRVAEHQEKERQRQEAERERIRKEEAERVEREERARIRAEQEAAEAERRRQTSEAIQQTANERDASPSAKVVDPTTPAVSAPTAPAASSVATPIAAASSSKPVKMRPTDAEIIDVLALHYRVHESKVLEWLCDMDLDTESAKLSAGMI